MIVIKKLPPHGFQFGIVSKRFKRTIFATTIGRINQSNDLKRYSFGFGWNLKGLQVFQIYKRF